MAAENGQLIRALDVPQTDEDPARWEPGVLSDKPKMPPLKLAVSLTEPAPEPPAQRKAPKAPPAPEPQTEPPIDGDDSLEYLATRRPGDMGRVVRAMLKEDGAVEQIAVLMIGLGATVAGRVMRGFDNDEMEAVAQAVAACEPVSAERKKEVFEAVRQRLLDGEYMLTGGPDFARDMLRHAVGERKAQAIMARLDGVGENVTALLRNMDPALITSFVSKEHPQTLTLILSQLDANQAAAILNHLPEDLQIDVMHRMGCMDNISPAILQNLEHSLYDELQAILAGQVTEIGGPVAVANILKRTGRTTEKAVLKALDEANGELAEKVRNQIFVFDDIANLRKNEIEILLDEVDENDLAVALKGGSEKLQNRIFELLGEKAAGELKEKVTFAGPVRMSDVEKVQLRIVQTARQLDDEGKIMIVRDSNDKFV